MPVFEDPEVQERQYNRLRRNVGADDSILTATLAEEYFLEAQELYPNSTAKMIAQAEVIALKGIRASAALLGKYAQNQHEEDLTKVFGNITEMLRDAQAAVVAAVDIVTDDTADAFFFEKAQGQRGR